MDSARSFYYLPIQSNPKLSHGFHLIAGRIAEQFRGEVPQLLLHSDHDRTRLLQLPRNVKQAEQEPLPVASAEVIKITATPLSVIDRPKFTIANLWNLGMDRVFPRQNFFRIGGGLLHGQQDELSTDYPPSQ